MTSMVVTKWFRDVGDGPQFNHISNGYNPDHETPAWVSEEQRKAWVNSIWAPERGELKDGVLLDGESR